MALAGPPISAKNRGGDVLIRDRALNQANAVSYFCPFYTDLPKKEGVGLKVQIPVLNTVGGNIVEVLQKSLPGSQGRLDRLDGISPGLVRGPGTLCGEVDEIMCPIQHLHGLLHGRNIKRRPEKRI